jgi:tetratricopeptide (TPR) repeat protein
MGHFSGVADGRPRRRAREAKRLWRWRGPILAFGLNLLCVGGAAAQTPARGGPAALQHADSLHVLDPKATLTFLEEVVAAEPSNYDARWRAARSAVATGLMSDPRDRGRWFKNGVAHGEQAIALRPNGVDGLYWTLANKGREALELSPVARVGAAGDIYELANRVLAIDPLHAGAHDALGKISYEVMRLSSVERFLTRSVLRKDAFRQASWQKAEAEMKRAVELDPTWNMLHLDLGRTYLYQGKWDLAVQELERAIALPLRNAGEAFFKREAEHDLPFARSRKKP